MSRSDQMVLMTGALPYGGLGGWRSEDAFDRPAMNLKAVIELVQLAERGKFHMLFLADGNAVRQLEPERRGLFEALAPTDRPTSFEPTTLMAALSQHTSHIGLFCTLTTTFNEPYNVARQLASLDHLSGGRTVWNVVTTSFPGDSVNYTNEPFPPHEVRYRRAVEFVQVCKGLWDSWAEDAFPQDKTSGRFVAADRVRRINHHGEFFHVDGPLNVAAMPQRYPVLFMAGQSEPGRDFAARVADCMIAMAPTISLAKSLRADIHARMATYGRRPDQIKIVTGCRGLVANTREEAHAIANGLAKLVTPELGLDYLSAQVHEDLSAYDVDGPLPDLTHDIPGVRGRRDAIYGQALENGWSIRQTYEYLIGGTGDQPFTGSPTDIADEMQRWFEEGACDGFVVSPPVVPSGLERFVELVIPELQRRGLFHDDYIGGTTRDELGIALGPNEYFAEPMADVMHFATS